MLAPQSEHARLSKSCAALEVKVGESTSSLRASLEQSDAHFAGLCAELDQRLAEKVGLQDARIQDVEGNVADQQRAFVTAVTTLETRFSEKNASQDAAFETQQQHFGDMLANYDRKFSDKHLAQDERMNSERERFGGLFSALEVRTATKSEEIVSMVGESADSLRPSSPKPAPRSLRRALLTPQVNSGSFYRCSKRF